MSEQRVGAVLRQWRKHRRMSQIDLSESAEVSTRHLSCIETGKTRASPEMLLVLASALEMPLKERNQLLLAGGYAPAYQDPTVASPQVERAVDVILQGAEPYPAIALDLNWDLRNANGAAARLFGALSPSIAARALAGERVNLMLALVEDPELREKVLNWTDVAAAAIDRLHREAVAYPGPNGPAPTLEALLRHPDTPSRFHRPELDHEPRTFIDFRVTIESETLSFFTTVQMLGTAIDTLASRMIFETYYPADEPTREWLNR